METLTKRCDAVAAGCSFEAHDDEDLVKEAQFEPLKILLVGSFLIFLGD
jgi:hypothetical protein